MKVKDIIQSHTNFVGTTIKFIVKPSGTRKQYYNSMDNFLNKQVAEMEVNTWFICGIKKNYCELIIVVERNAEYEKEERERWERLTSK